MAIFSTAAANAACNAVVDLLDAGSGGNPALKWRSAGQTVLLTNAFTDTAAFGNADAGVATAGTIDTAAVVTVKGTPTDVAFCNRSGTAVLTVPVDAFDLSGHNVFLLGDNPRVESLTVTMPSGA